jgi:hypothetical protein
MGSCRSHHGSHKRAATRVRIQAFTLALSPCRMPLAWHLVDVLIEIMGTPDKPALTHEHNSEGKIKVLRRDWLSSQSHTSDFGNS